MVENLWNFSAAYCFLWLLTFSLGVSPLIYQITVSSCENKKKSKQATSWIPQKATNVEKSSRELKWCVFFLLLSCWLPFHVSSRISIWCIFQLFHDVMPSHTTHAWLYVRRELVSHVKAFDKDRQWITFRQSHDMHIHFIEKLLILQLMHLHDDNDLDTGTTTKLQRKCTKK